MTVYVIHSYCPGEGTEFCGVRKTREEAISFSQSLMRDYPHDERYIDEPVIDLYKDGSARMTYSYDDEIVEEIEWRIEPCEMP